MNTRESSFFEYINLQSCKMTEKQNGLIEGIWSHFVSTGKPLPFRAVPQFIGKDALHDVLTGLGGGLIQEVEVGFDSSLSLTMHGIYLTKNGPIIKASIVMLLDFVRNLYEGDKFIVEVDRNAVRKRLNLSVNDSTILFRALSIGLPSNLPIRLSGWSNDGETWRLSVSDKILDLYRAADTLSYLDDCMISEYNDDLPFSSNARTSQLIAGVNESRDLLKLDMNSMENSSSSPAYIYVSQNRLASLRNIKSQDFDFSRLIRMCEELNSCSEHTNAHAVIMLLRAILDHVPPIFCFKTFSQVAANYGGGGRSFKKSLDRLDRHSRTVADRFLHTPIRKKESVADMHEVNFSQELDTLLSEVCRIS